VCISWMDTQLQRLAAVLDASLCPGDVPDRIEVDAGTGAAVSCDLRSCAGEAALLGEFGRVLDQHLAHPHSQLVTYSGRGFDLPVLLHRGIKHGVAEGRARLVKAMGENRYRPSTHLDLIDVVTFS